MGALPMKLQHGYDYDGQDVAGWWASEKLNGWRAVWTGLSLQIRGDGKLSAPAWFIDGLPDMPLDGELFAGRGTNHNDVNRLAHRDWSKLVFCPFDIPITGMKIEAAIETLSGLPTLPYVKPVTFSRVQSTADAMERMRSIVASGGEGLMLRKPCAGYSVDYRTDKLLKLKP